MASTSGFQASEEPKWSLGDIPHSSSPLDEQVRQRVPGSFAEGQEKSWRRGDSSTEPSGAAPGQTIIPNEQPSEETQSPGPNKTYRPRTCRICLEVVNPTFHPPSPSLPSIFRSTGYVSYDSEDPASGRLLRPCKCKGSSRYVHSGCLQQWRYADPSFGNRNYWVCPTCGFQYLTKRLDWGRAINNFATQIGLTITIFLTAIFVLGFIADPIINLYFDPYDTLISGRRELGESVLGDDDQGGWFEHFMKGLASLGLLGFLKVILLNPWNWWNVRQSGLMSGGRGNTGRERMQNISWIVIVLGVATFLWAVYKTVRNWSRRALEYAQEIILDVPMEDDEDEPDELPTEDEPAR